MRVIAGKFKSRRLVAPDVETTRPTTDRAKESLFNVLANLIDFTGIRILDLFAGSGALGIEALSRGAKEAVFVEKNRKAVQLIEQNIRTLGVSNCTQVISGDVYTFVQKVKEPFDLILTDAPYVDIKAIQELPAICFDRGIIAEDGIAVFEHRSTDSVLVPPKAVLLKEIKAGEVGFTILTHSPSSE